MGTYKMKKKRLKDDTHDPFDYEDDHDFTVELMIVFVLAFIFTVGGLIICFYWFCKTFLS